MRLHLECENDQTSTISTLQRAFPAEVKHFELPNPSLHLKEVFWMKENKNKKSPVASNSTPVDNDDLVDCETTQTFCLVIYIYGSLQYMTPWGPKQNRFYSQPSETYQA